MTLQLPLEALVDIMLVVLLMEGNNTPQPGQFRFLQKSWNQLIV